MGSFEVFTEKSGKAASAGKWASYRSDVLAISRDAYEAMGKPALVVFMFDRENHRIGIRAAQSDELHFAYPVRQQKGARSRLVSAVRFMQTYGIESKKTWRRDAVVEDGVLIIDASDLGASE